MNKSHSLGLLAPRASAAAPTAAPAESWYSINALGGGVVEIKIYDDIGAWGITARQFSEELRAKGAFDAKRVDLRIHSYGGDVMDGFVIYNLLRGLPGELHGYVDGVACSMASVVAMACTRLSMPENAWMMIHKPWGGQIGDADDMREYADFLDRNEKNLVAAYSRKTGKTAEEITPLLKPDTWLTGKEAVEAGFADELLEPLAAAAALTSNRYTEYSNMPDAVKALMQPRAQGNHPSAPAQPTPAPATPAAPAAPVAAVPQDDAAVRAQILAQDGTRRSQIAERFGTFASAHADLLRQCQDDINCTPAAAAEKLLTALGAGSQASDKTVSIQVFSSTDRLMADAENALLARLGLAKATEGNGLRGFTLGEMARAMLASHNIATGGLDKMNMVGQAFTHTSGDFGRLLGNVAHKSMLKGYEEAETSFQQFCSIGELTDFKVAERLDLEGFPTLDKVPEGGEYKYATVGERGERVQLATYGKLFSITRQAIINDDLRAFTRLPQKMGAAAMRTVNKLVFAILTGNPKMADGKALFHADHKNLLEAGAPSAANLSKARAAMRKQRDSADSVLNIRPGFILAPVALEDLFTTILGAEYNPDVALDARAPNPVRNMAEVITDAELDLVSATAWFLLAGKAYDTIEVNFLDGVAQPTMEQQSGWTIDGVDFKVRIDATAAPLDFRTMQKNPGA